MKILGNLRQRYGYYLLEKRVAHLKRDRVLHNFESAKKIGVLFKLDGNTIDYEIISNFLEFLYSKKIEVSPLGFFEGKKMPHLYLHSKEIAIFSKKDLNIYFIPDKSFIKQFKETEFDILIDLSLNYSFPIKYISTLSKAKYKVGRLKQDEHQMDLTINITENKLEYLIDQIKHFITLIKK